MQDEETGAEPRAVSASIADPFLLIIRDDSSAFIAQMDSSNELEELDKEDPALVTTKWLTGCLYADTTGVFAADMAEKPANSASSVLMFLLSASGALQVSGVMAVPQSSRLDTDNGPRYIVFRISQARSTLQRGSPTYLQVSRPTMSSEREQRRRHWPR